MDSSHERVTVVDNAAESRYEVWVGDQMAFLTYKRGHDHINLMHTEVPEALEGQGIASALARAALSDARAHGLKVIPNCPFVAAYIRRHPEEMDLVEPGWRHLLERRKD
jgi:uncharacterized protein